MVSSLNDQQQLEAAFEQFNAVSGQLIDAYRQLEVQVNVLNAQLDEANNQLRKQRDENAALAERLALLLQVLPAGVVELSVEGRVVVANLAAAEMLPGCQAGADWQALSGMLSRSDVDDTYALPQPEGARRLTLQYQELPASGGRIVLIHDVTRLHQLTGELASQQKLAEMGSMAAALAHQLRTPLASAMLYTANLKQDIPRAEDRARFVEKSLARMRALEGLMQNMLGYVRGQVSSLEPSDPGLLLEEVCQVLAPQCQDKGVVLDCNLLDTSAIKVMIDRKALQGALTNLLENALQFTPRGGRIGAALTASEGWAVFTVEDSGPGVPDDAMERIFEPFFTMRSGGTGLGLAIVKKVADELGGGVRCYNKPAGGACFELQLPTRGA
ncbi:PAS domain-containing sensor histidine kinase [Chromobacterium sp. IIBBL 290-4]|uniref:sensor histidine kinase n=1 Tax=Chromobacterium sp. IIBBL 290-4 TaxID=2953890 RepID=UPI0020B8C01B|nr:HAMP domain-containing sensor histidine kinase [Chromobacterium sp. IIBBL 290-4]UTH72660.1 HAMP domain-containing histidine kinase [Chromobacterium sp. IIBBL 290-4]